MKPKAREAGILSIVSSALRVLIPILGAALVIGIAEQFTETLAHRHLRQGLVYLPWFELESYLVTSGRTIPLGTLPVALAWLTMPRLEKRWLSGLAIVVGMTVGAYLLVQEFGQPVVVCLGAIAVTSVLAVLLVEWRPVDRLRKRCWISSAVILGSLGMVLGVTTVRTRSAVGNDSRNVVLIVLDTVAATHMAGYGYARVTTPELDRMAAEGMVFRNSYSAAPWTLPTHASLFTGLYPISHGATQENLFLGDSHVTVAELLKDRGYRTFGATNNAVIAGNSNLDQGFDTYLQMSQRGQKAQRPKPGAHPTNLAVQDFLASVDDDDRFFVFLNFIEAHSPYKPRREMAERFLEPEWSRRISQWAANQSWDRHYMEPGSLTEEEMETLRALYDAELAGLSRTIDELVREISARGMLEDTVIIVTSDHGENIGDHGHMGHVFDLHDTLLRVPLLLYGGGLPKGVERFDPVTTVDVFHTILALAGSEQGPGRGQGRDLLAAGASDVEDLPLVAEYYYPSQVLSVLDQRGKGYRRRFEELAPYLRRQRSIRLGDWKLIWATDGQHALYDLGEDPGEASNLADREPERVRQMEQALLDRLRQLSGLDLQAVARPYAGPESPQGFENLDEETREQLRALGYLD